MVFIDQLIATVYHSCTDLSKTLVDRARKGINLPICIPAISFPPTTLICLVCTIAPSCSQELKNLFRNSCCMLSMLDSFQAARCNWPTISSGCGLLEGSISKCGYPGRIMGQSIRSYSRTEYHGWDFHSRATSASKALSSP